MYYSARYYLPGFISADTIVPGSANPQAFNLYSYVLNQPTTMTAPDGHMPGGLCYLYPGICSGQQKTIRPAQKPTNNPLKNGYDDPKKKEASSIQNAVGGVTASSTSGLTPSANPTPNASTTSTPSATSTPSQTLPPEGVATPPVTTTLSPTAPACPQYSTCDFQARMAQWRERREAWKKTISGRFFTKGDLGAGLALLMPTHWGYGASGNLGLAVLTAVGVYGQVTDNYYASTGEYVFSATGGGDKSVADLAASAVRGGSGKVGAGAGGAGLIIGKVGWSASDPSAITDHPSFDLSAGFGGIVALEGSFSMPIAHHDENSSLGLYVDPVYGQVPWTASIGIGLGCCYLGGNVGRSNGPSWRRPTW